MFFLPNPIRERGFLLKILYNMLTKQQFLHWNLRYPKWCHSCIQTKYLVLRGIQAIHSSNLQDAWITKSHGIWPDPTWLTTWICDCEGAWKIFSQMVVVQRWWKNHPNPSKSKTINPQGFLGKTSPGKNPEMYVLGGWELGARNPILFGWDDHQSPQKKLVKPGMFPPLHRRFVGAWNNTSPTDCLRKKFHAFCFCDCFVGHRFCWDWFACFLLRIPKFYVFQLIKTYSIWLLNGHNSK